MDVQSTGSRAGNQQDTHAPDRTASRLIGIAALIVALTIAVAGFTWAYGEWTDSSDSSDCELSSESLIEAYNKVKRGCK